MPRSIEERIEKLRGEIAEIRRRIIESGQKDMSGKVKGKIAHRWQKVAMEAERRRRMQRLEEILREIKSLTEWKKL